MINSVRSIVKSVFNRFGYDIHRCESGPRNPIDILRLAVEHRMATHPRLLVVQIGAFDGKAADPVHQYVMKHAFKAIMVEPLPDFFSRLKLTYADQPQVSFENVAIGHEDGEALLWRIKPGSPVASEAHSLASFDRQNLIRARDRVHGIETYIESISVPTMTMATLLSKHRVDHVDLLQVDTEGYDAEIIRLTLASGQRPSIINYEIVNLSSQVRAATRRMLADAGYQYLDVGSDAVAIACE